MSSSSPTSTTAPPSRIEPIDLAYSRNQLIGDDSPTTFAVMEISSRACKLVIVDVSKLRHGFAWSAFENDSTLTNIGLLLNQQNRIEWEDFQTHVLPTLERYLLRLIARSIPVVYCIATASLRDAINSTELVEQIYQSVGLRFQVLSQSEEARATIHGYQWSVGYTAHPATILIDQGGGSTEVSYFGLNNTLSPPLFQQIAMGTSTCIRAMLQQESLQDSLSLSTSLRDEAQHIGFQIQPVIKQLLEQPITQIIGVGSAITDATGKESNQHQHRVTLSVRQLQSIYDNAFSYLTNHPSFTTLGEFKTFYSMQASTTEKAELNQYLVRYFGLSMFIQIMRRIKMDIITVNGVGLRYGICAQVLRDIYPLLESDPAQYPDLYPDEIVTVDALSEGETITGTVSNVDLRFGIFVVLNQEHTGLLHKQSLLPHHPKIHSFSKGDSIEVRIHKIKLEEPPRFILRLCQ